MKSLFKNQKFLGLVAAGMIGLGGTSVAHADCVSDVQSIEAFLNAKMTVTIQAVFDSAQDCECAKRALPAIAKLIQRNQNSEKCNPDFKIGTYGKRTPGGGTSLRVFTVSTNKKLEVGSNSENEASIIQIEIPCGDPKKTITVQDIDRAYDERVSKGEALLNALSGNTKSATNKSSESTEAK